MEKTQHPLGTRKLLSINAPKALNSWRVLLQQRQMARWLQRAAWVSGSVALWGPALVFGALPRDPPPPPPPSVCWVSWGTVLRSEAVGGLWGSRVPTWETSEQPGPRASRWRRRSDVRAVTQRTTLCDCHPPPRPGPPPWSPVLVGTYLRTPPGDPPSAVGACSFSSLGVGSPFSSPEHRGECRASAVGTELTRPQRKVEGGIGTMVPLFGS